MTTPQATAQQPLDQAQWLEQLRRQIEQGNPQACWQMVQFVEQQGAAGNQLEAQNRIQLLTHASKQGIGEASVLLGRWFLNGHYVPKDLAKAILQFEHAASVCKSADGYYHLAEIFQTGVGMPAQPQKGEQYLKKAVAMHHPDAIFTYANQLLQQQPEQAWRLLTDNYLKRQHIASLQLIQQADQFKPERVETWLIEHAHQDPVISAFLAARYWQNGQPEQALPYAEFAAGHQQSIGSYVRAMIELQREQGDIELAQQLLFAAAQQGHHDAAYRVAIDIFAHAEQLEPTQRTTLEQQAVQWLAQAAQGGHAVAQYVLAQCWDTGIGVEVNPQEALAWFDRAAAQGHIDAVFQVAIRLPQTHEQHLPLLQHAAQAGHTKAMMCIGLYCQQNQQPEQAITWFEQARQHNDPRASYLLGLAYRDGLGVTADSQQGIALLQTAAENGDSDGYFALYETYRDGLGVRKNKKLQQQYLKLAQQAGHPQAVELSNTSDTSNEGQSSETTILPEQPTAAKPKTTTKKVSKAVSTPAKRETKNTDIAPSKSTKSSDDASVAATKTKGQGRTKTTAKEGNEVSTVIKKPKAKSATKPKPEQE